MSISNRKLLESCPSSPLNNDTIIGEVKSPESSMNYSLMNRQFRGEQLKHNVTRFNRVEQLLCLKGDSASVHLSQQVTSSTQLGENYNNNNNNSNNNNSNNNNSYNNNNNNSNRMIINNNQYNHTGSTEQEEKDEVKQLEEKRSEDQSKQYYNAIGTSIIDNAKSAKYSNSSQSINLTTIQMQVSQNFNFQRQESNPNVDIKLPEHLQNNVLQSKLPKESIKLPSSANAVSLTLRNQQPSFSQKDEIKQMDNNISIQIDPFDKTPESSQKDKEESEEIDENHHMRIDFWAIIFLIFSDLLPLLFYVFLIFTVFTIQGYNFVIENNKSSTDSVFCKHDFEDNCKNFVSIGGFSQQIQTHSRFQLWFTKKDTQVYYDHKNNFSVDIDVQENTDTFLVVAHSILQIVLILVIFGYIISYLRFKGVFQSGRFLNFELNELPKNNLRFILYVLGFFVNFFLLTVIIYDFFKLGNIIQVDLIMLMMLGNFILTFFLRKRQYIYHMTHEKFESTLFRRNICPDILLKYDGTYLDQIQAYCYVQKRIFENDTKSQVFEQGDKHLVQSVFFNRNFVVKQVKDEQKYIKEKKKLSKSSFNPNNTVNMSTKEKAQLDMVKKQVQQQSQLQINKNNVQQQKSQFAQHKLQNSQNSEVDSLQNDEAVESNNQRQESESQREEYKISVQNPIQQSNENQVQNGNIHTNRSEKNQTNNDEINKQDQNLKAHQRRSTADLRQRLIDSGQQVKTLKGIESRDYYKSTSSLDTVKSYLYLIFTEYRNIIWIQIICYNYIQIMVLNAIKHKQQKENLQCYSLNGKCHSQISIVDYNICISKYLHQYLWFSNQSDVYCRNGDLIQSSQSQDGLYKMEISSIFYLISILNAAAQLIFLIFWIYLIYRFSKCQRYKLNSGAFFYQMREFQICKKFQRFQQVIFFSAFITLFLSFLCIIAYGGQYNEAFISFYVMLALFLRQKDGYYFYQRLDKQKFKEAIFKIKRSEYIRYSSKYMIQKWENIANDDYVYLEQIQTPELSNKKYLDRIYLILNKEVIIGDIKMIRDVLTFQEFEIQYK